VLNSGRFSHGQDQLPLVNNERLEGRKEKNQGERKFWTPPPRTRSDHKIRIKNTSLWDKLKVSQTVGPRGKQEGKVLNRAGDRQHVFHRSGSCEDDSNASLKSAISRDFAYLEPIRGGGTRRSSSHANEKEDGRVEGTA